MISKNEKLLSPQQQCETQLCMLSNTIQSQEGKQNTLVQLKNMFKKCLEIEKGVNSEIQTKNCSKK